MMLIINNIPTRASLPAFLIGLQHESLLDLTWTDPTLGVQKDAYWPEEAKDTPIDENTQRYGDEILTMDKARKVVMVTREVVALTAEEIAERLAAALLAKRTALVVTPWQIRKAMNEKGIRSAVESAVAASNQETKDAYEFAQEFKRLDTLVINLAAALGKDDEFMDGLFTLAATL